MKKSLQTLQLFCAGILLSLLTVEANAQTLEWRLVGLTYNAADPDGAGPAQGSATFKLQIHTVSGTVNNINAISTGWSYQSTKAIIPTTPSGPGCPATVNNPANVTISPTFAAAGFSYTTVNQCGVAAQTPTGVGGPAYDRRVVGTLDNGLINLTTTWVDVFTVTLWSLDVTDNDAGLVIINSGSGGSPGAFGSYAVSDDQANAYIVNSLTYTTAVVLPISLSEFDVTCTGKGVKLNWQTLSEQNNDYFEIQRSSNGVNGWTSIGKSKAFSTGNATTNYEFMDLQGGANFYRLRQVDKDGRGTYSGIEKANCNTSRSDLLVYPTPAKSVLNIVVATERSSTATILVLDAAGKVVLQQKTGLQKGSNNIRLNVAGLARGEYFLKLVSPDMSKTEKISIIN